MLNTKPSDNLLRLIEAHYTATTLKKCNVKWFIDGARARPNATIVDLTLDRITEDVLTTSTFDANIAALRGVARLKGATEEEVAAIKEGIVIALPFREGKVGPKHRDAILENKEDIKEYCYSLETATQRVLSYLSLVAGVKASDLLRDVYKLQKVKEGLIEVGKRTTHAQAKARVITFDPSYINDVLDPFGEHLSLLSNTIYRADNVGLVSGYAISDVLTNGALGFNQLRASYAIHRRKEGVTWKELAELMGVGATSIRTLVNRYLKANNIDL
jgi:hypothetical protein